MQGKNWKQIGKYKHWYASPEHIPKSFFSLLVVQALILEHKKKKKASQSPRKNINNKNEFFPHLDID